MIQRQKESKNHQAAAVTTLSSILDDKDAGPRQVTLKSYPQDSFGAQNRAFHHSWFVKNTLWEYVVSLNATFCFPC